MDSRILGIIGAALVIIGIFLPLVTVSVAQAGISQSASFFDSIKAGSWEGYVLLLSGIASLILAALRKYRFLIATGLIALIVVVLNFINLKAGLAKALGMADAESLERMGIEVSTQWLGWIVLIIGSLILIAAGATGRGAPAPGANWGAAPPPPPPPYPPAR
jgi:hypothetical protein